MKEAFNDYLHRKRVEAGYRRWQVANSLGISKFLYHRYERGYSTPKPEIVKKINELYGEDFEPYLHGESSYPALISYDKEERKFRTKVREAFQKRWTRLLAIIIPLVLLINIPFAIATFVFSGKATTNFYSDTYMSIREKAVELGEPFSDPLGNSKQKILSYSYDANGDAFYAAVKAPIDVTNTSEMSFVFTRRAANDSTFGGTTLTKLDYSWRNEFTFTMINNTTGEYKIQTGHRIGRSQFEIEKTKEQLNEGSSMEAGLTAIKMASRYADEAFEAFFTDAKNLGTYGESGSISISSFYQDVFLVKDAGDRKVAGYNITYAMFAYVGSPLAVLVSGLSLFFFVLSREKVEVVEEEGVGDTPLPDNRRLPFLIGTSAYRLLGAISLLLGSIYIIISLADRFGMISLVADNVNTQAIIDLESNLFFMGVVLLYIIGLRDDFYNPRHLYFRTIMYGAIGVGIACLQTFFALSMSHFQNNFVELLLSYMPPNIFLPIFSFHICGMFLFATPKWATGTKLKVWRSLSLASPIIFLTVAVVNTTFKALTGSGIPNYSYYLGAGHYAYSLVTYCFLFGNYFLRNYFVKKYGTVYLKGDMFALYKNLTLVLPCLLIGAIELGLYFVPGAKVLGFGDSYSLLLLAVFMFFYRGYNDKNHLWAMIASQTIYAIGFIDTYAVTIALAVLFLIIH